MDDPLIVGVGDGAGQRQQQLGRGARGQQRGSQPLVKALAGDELHRQEGAVPLLAHLENLHDVRMREPGGGFRFGAKPCTLARAMRRKHHLQGDDATQAALPGLIDDAHPAAADLLNDVVAGQEWPLVAIRAETAIDRGRAHRWAVRPR